MNDATTSAEEAYPSAGESPENSGQGNSEKLSAETLPAHSGGTDKVPQKRIRKHTRRKRNAAGASPRLCGDDCANGVRLVATTVQGCVDVVQCAKGVCKRIMRICEVKEEK